MTLPTDLNVSTITSAGLAIESNPQLVQYLIACFQAIYGNDINVDSNSPDGQIINILAQINTDLLELLLATYNLAAVPTSYGTRLDQLVALNGLARKQGTYTQAQVNIIVTQALTLPGLDQTAVPAFTVADGAGNQYQLVTSHVFGGAGNATLTFQSVTIGQIQTTANTITNIITATIGVTTANNPSIASDTIGVNEETDAQLKVRHNQSFAIAATNQADSLEAALNNLADITDAYVVENDTGGTVNGIPAHSIWTIVTGGTAVEIGLAIYAKKPVGCGMKGSTIQVVTRPNGSTFTAAWDASISQPLYIKFSIIWQGSPTLANADIINALAAALVYKLGQKPSIADVLGALRIIAPTAIITLSPTQGVSTDNASWASQVSPTDAQHYFTVSAANIAIT